MSSSPSRLISIALAAIIWFLPSAVLASESDRADSHPLSGIPLRSIGPALTSGRVSDFAFHPDRPELFYVAMSSAGVWRTANNGVTWTSLFEQQGSYATGVVVIDPHDSNTVWVGTGENNGQRSVGYGDGVYRSKDGGKTWKNMGLRNSGHVSMIRFHPEEPGVMWVAAQGPLWSSGGDRGLYYSSNGGETWSPTLQIDEHTGVNEFLLHPADPDIILASTYQRRRHLWTLINGGPGSGLHKSTDGGRSWARLDNGLPDSELGRIGLAEAASKPGMVYAVIESDEESRGIYRSTDFGQSWEKRSSHHPSSAMYYNELIVDPNDADRVYSVDTFTHVSEDGGLSWERLPFEHRHVDDHALWINPDRSEHLYIGGDGGIYESWDYGQSWRHIQNLPTVQFYRATPDNDLPFYNVCAGTQDNHTLCGPSQTTFTDGITNADWWISKFGDGFKTQFDPADPNIVYSQSQYGGLVRFDRISGERTRITPQPGAEENQFRWNWSSPLIVSPHDPHRLYYGAEKLFRSDDRGSSWDAISPDLSRQLDRNTLEVMGQVWSVDAIAKNASTSPWGSIIALSESPLQEGLIYVGTDDGLIRVSQDGGQNWNRIESISGVPDMALVEDIVASLHDANVAYAVIDNHKQGDYRPYVIKTTNQGRSWSVISGNLPRWGSAHTIAEDHVEPDLLFVGTEFGLFFSQQGGRRWHEFSELPTIAVRDLEIQRRENDLVLGTFGLGVYILDDYSPLRVDTGALNEPTLFEISDSWLFVPDTRRGWGGLGDYGNAKYSAPNPDHGVTISYYLPASILSLREQRQALEQKQRGQGQELKYPSDERLRAEDNEKAPRVVVTIRDSEDNVVRRFDAPTTQGFHRVNWDLRHAAPHPVSVGEDSSRSPWQRPPQGPLATPGQYSAAIAIHRNGQSEADIQKQTFALTSLKESPLVSEDPAAVLAFKQQISELFRVVQGTVKGVAEINNRLDHLLVAVDKALESSEQHGRKVHELQQQLNELAVVLIGDESLQKRALPHRLSINSRVSYLMQGIADSRSEVPTSYLQSRDIAQMQFRQVLGDVKQIVAELQALESELETAGAPWTPGRLPNYD